MVPVRGIAGCLNTDVSGGTNEGDQEGVVGYRAARGNNGGQCAERTVHPGSVLSGGTLCGRRVRLLWRSDRLLDAGQHVRWRERREPEVGGMRDGVQRFQGRGMLRAVEEEPWRGLNRGSAVEWHRLRPLP